MGLVEQIDRLRQSADNRLATAELVDGKLLIRRYDDSLLEVDLTGGVEVTGAEGPMGPAGPQGDQGIPGPEGPQGPAGPNGSIDLLTDVDLQTTIPASGHQMVWVDSGGGAMVLRSRPRRASGLLASRPTVANSLEGDRYFATDVQGGSWFDLISGAWVQTTSGLLKRGRGLLASWAQKAQLVLVGNAALTDIPGASLQFTYKGLPIKAAFHFPEGFFDVVNSLARIYLVDAASGGVLCQASAYGSTSTTVGVAASVPGATAVNPDKFLLRGETESTQLTSDAVGAPVPLVVDQVYTWKLQSYVPPTPANMTFNLNQGNAAWFEITEQ